MSNQTSYQPPFTLTPAILRLVAEIAEALGRLTAQVETDKALRLRLINRIRTFIEFMLRMILDAVSSAETPQVAPQVTPQVKQLLQTLVAAMSREEIQSALGLKDRKSFRVRYLTPALAEGFIEMTLPEKPNSRLQKYLLTDKGRRWLQRRDEV